MRIVGLAFALPSTSFSSSYEVFIAEKELSGHHVQLIKLVYWFLPYQTKALRVPSGRLKDVQAAGHAGSGLR